MNNSAYTETPTEASGAGPEQTPASLDELQVWSALLNQVVATGSNLGQLFMLEVRLALGDVRRLFFLLLLLVPLVLLVWVSFATLIAWLVIDYSQSVGLGLLVFLIQQIALLCLMQRRWRRYANSLGLPLTRQHLQSYIDITRSGEVPHHGSHHQESR